MAPATAEHEGHDERATYVSVGTKRLRWVLRTLILISGIYQTLFGEREIGILTLICLAGITAPAFFTRGLVAYFPIEIEIVLFGMVVIQYVLGEARDYYTTIPYYDKFVHAMLPGLIGFIGFLIAYALVASGRLIVSTWVIVVLIVLMSLGVAAVEEIVEYTSDMLLYPRIPGWHHFQGNAQEDPWHDTMNDLIADIIGAAFGALLGLWFIGRAAKRQSKRLPELVDELQGMFGRGSAAKRD
jgi:uncharacterized membrane protein YjdF